MKILIFVILNCLSAFAQQMSGDPFVQQVIKNKIQACRYGNPRNCIKPVNLPGSKVKAVEIRILSANQVQFTTYDQLGTPVDVEKDFNLRVNSDKQKSMIDVELEIKPTASDLSLRKFCEQKYMLACLLQSERLLSTNENIAKSQIIKMCDVGMMDACLLILDHKSFSKSVADKKNALRRLCNNKQYSYCAMFAYVSKEDKKDFEVISELIEGCTKSSLSSCLALSSVFEKENPKESVRSLELGCNLPSGGEVCYYLATILAQSNKMDKSKEFFKKACTKGISLACNNLPHSDVIMLLRNILLKENKDFDKINLTFK